MAQPDQPNLFLKLRTELGKTQREIGDAAGYTDAYIGMIENGQRIPLFSSVPELARAYGVPESRIENELVRLHRAKRKSNGSADGAKTSAA